jgi:cyclic pyranopterin monophosphate synthase
MIDITHKSNTLRYAHATAELRLSKMETLERVNSNTVPKGNVFEMSKAAGLLAVKQTHLTIPDCHPLPIEFAAVSFEVKDLSIHIHIEVKTIYKTGVEVEAMHGASIVALTMYDMLKPIDQGIEIHGIKLLEKTGGKTSFKTNQSRPFRAAVVVCSDSISAGKKEDKAGLAISEKLKKQGVEVAHYTVISDDEEAIIQQVNSAKNENFDLLIFTGGTGLSPRDKTPETILPMLHREIPGIAEQIRAYGQLRTPYSMLSRSVCGLIDNMLVMTLPGSTKGASESMDAIFPAVLHVFRVLDADFKH